MGIQEILIKIDSKPFIQFVSDVVREISTQEIAEQAYKAIRLAVRCACLLDLHAETQEAFYIEDEEGFNKQREAFYELIPPEYHQELQEIEAEVSQFFCYEQDLINRIKKGDKFSTADITTYLEGKSGDNLFYGRVLEILVPEWDLTNELQLQTILFDLGKDLEDYDEDIRNDLPNVLYMYLSGKISREEIPLDSENAIQLAQELGVSAEIISHASRIRNRALDSRSVKNSSVFADRVQGLYYNIVRILH